MKVHDSYAPLLTTQDYTPRQSIDGVELLQLSYQSDDGGNFTELARLSNGAVAGLQSEFIAEQVSMSVLTPGAIKAYHLHENQDDLWFVPPTHRLLVNLHDVRESSPTFDLHQRLVLGGGQCRLLRIPRGVAHGAANVYEQPMFLFYFTSAQFSAENPDEHRLQWDQFGADVWEITKG